MTAPPAPDADAAAHMRAVDAPHRYRLLNHGPAVLVSARSRGVAGVMAAAWACMLDFDKLSVVIDKSAATRALLEESGHFAIQVPTVAQAALVHWLGTHSLHDDAQKLAHAEAGVENEADFEANIESDLPEVSISEEGPVRHLHLGTPWIQGSINLRHPDRLELQYVQRMMGWLLLAPDLDEAVQGHAMQLGLGAGALTRFCMQTLGMCATAIEINPLVLAACRHWFRLPEDGPLLRVVLANYQDRKSVV